MTSEELEKQIELTQDLEDISLITGAFKVSKEMLDFYIDWYIEHTKNPPFKTDKFSGYCERKATHALKLSIIMSASRSSDMIITLEDFKRAVKYLQEAERFMPNVFSGYGRRENADIVNHIMNYIMHYKRVERKELLQRFLSDLTFAQLDEIINTLCEIQFCTKSVYGAGSVVIEYKEQQ